jgi:putative tryptophan/tyrosine transport system substrate-binding protein
MPKRQMLRREAITILGGAAAWPFVARAQQVDQSRRIGVLTGFSQTDEEGQSLLAAFRERLATLGWIEGRNLSIAIRWGDAVDRQRMLAYGVELTRMKPDVILVHGSRSLEAVRRETDRIPIVFASVSDPVGSGYVVSLARPGGNVTGVAVYDGVPSPKLLELLKEMAPNLRRVGFVITPDNLGFQRQLQAMEKLGRSLDINVTALLIRDPERIAPAVEAFAQEPNGGLVVSSDVFMITHRQRIIAAAALHRLPAAYQDRTFVVAGGMFSYGVDRKERYRRAATYVYRILQGAKPSELPIQQPANFEFVLNMGTAKALGFPMPRIFRARADEIIE